ncbi:peptide chain release factor H [Mucilaginibacter achroorhodeus]|uniref:Peptide chain release factor H n=1 Tax=Mucilaginibacter achroorhodeus TaxID=2599294 RepID=A0A563UAY3_9SPHI|nr:peptide chain release factor H [Mucilaginibacter achroorhodeus]TWR28547.1 peptide chain release factor H [Mucilaginibacter achroorhodeus]
MEKMIIQITSGKGPAECCRVVALVQQLMLKQGQLKGIDLEVLENKPAEIKGTMLSATMLASGHNLIEFIKEWEGTILWIGESPFRKFHKRKNWFVGIAAFNITQLSKWNANDVKFETTRASGPGGQNVNKVESAVRGTHLPTGLQVLAMDSRSQLENKKLCLVRLEQKLMVSQTEKLMAAQQSQWMQHNLLERGNPVKTINAPLM